LPLTLAPPALRLLGNLNPLAYVVNAARSLFLGNLANATVVEGFVISGALALLALVWVTRAFRRAAWN
jgi:ABC-2 type transport system permease protein